MYVLFSMYNNLIIHVTVAGPFSRIYDQTPYNQVIDMSE